MTNNWKKYILWFAQEHVEFRKAEIDSIIKLFGLNVNKISNEEKKPFWIVELPNEESARKLASRSVSLRCILELWGHSNSISKMHENVREYISTRNNVDIFFKPETSFKITIETYNKHFTQKEKVNKIEMFDYLPFKGSVNLKTPQVEWWCIEFYGLNPVAVPDSPFDALFGRWITDGQRNLITELSLKKRKFIGNTSMDAQLSLLMANQGLVKEGSLVFDPFVGTGSLLVSAAKFGGYVLGADIDYMMIHAKSRPTRITQKVREQDESIKMNLRQYGCEQYYLDVIISDFSRSIWREDIQFDCIITDPPYGIREAIERIETKVSTKRDSRLAGTPHYPSTSHYSLNSLYPDLLNFAAKHLSMNGRLVCWIPFHRNDYSNETLPQHKNLQLISNSEQILSGLTSRRLLTYEKISEYTVDDSDGLKQNVLGNFRERYFDYGAETRSDRRMRNAEIREIGRQEALNRGKTLDENGKVVNKIV